MDELVEKLSSGNHPVEAARPDKSLKSLKACVDRKYVHIMFKETGTELGTELDLAKCELNALKSGATAGKIHLEGALTLNYEKVRVIADIDLESLEGTGSLQPIDAATYEKIIGNSNI
jgi:hypothetical protein